METDTDRKKTNKPKASETKSTLKKCTLCTRGKIQEIGTETCFKCVGTGRNLKSRAWNDYCRNCNGAGSVPFLRSRSCYTCSGTGYVY